MLELLDLFFTFAKVGMFTFGGGYAMISILDDTCVEKKKWITHEDILNLTVIAESTPGPVAINCSTFVGYKKRGIVGAIAATIGMIVPSFVIIYLISIFLGQFLEIPWVAAAFSGIKISVAILIFDAGLNMLKQMKKSKFTVGVAGVSLALMLITNLTPLSISSTLLMFLAAVLSLAMYSIKAYKEKDKQKQKEEDK